MPKRRTSTAAACPVCTIKFDPEIHIPFMGSCGDSICAVCVDEKKIEACPVCEKERAFLPKKKNNLALELLKTITEMEASYAKKAKLDVGEDSPGELVSRRQISMEMACPGCSSVFDIDAHVPFVGSCGHSICAICLNETKITTCPVCRNPGGFLWKQKNELATDMLTASAENEAKDSKRANLNMEEESFVSEEPIPAILDPNNRHFLAQIVNQLSPRSFINFGSTCKSLHDYCFSSKDIKINYDIYMLQIMGDADDLEFHLAETRQDFKCDEYMPVDYAGYKYGFLSSAACRRRLRNYPFCFTLDGLTIWCETTDSVFTSLRSFLAEFPHLRISDVTTYDIIRESNALAQFVKDFHVDVVYIYRSESFPEVPVLDQVEAEDALVFLLQHIDYFECKDSIDERLLLNASVPKLTLENMSISKETFLDLIPRLADLTGEIDWMIGCQTLIDFDYETLFSFNVKPFDYKGPVPKVRPLLFIKDDEPDECWLLRNDGKVLYCLQGQLRHKLCIKISMYPSREYPRCLRRRRESYRV